MTTPLFDTLNYATLLKKGDVQNAEIHATCLAEVLSDTLYTKQEIDMRLERAIDHFEKMIDKRFQTLDKRFQMIDKQFETIDKRFQTIDRQFQTIDKRFHELELRMEKAINRSFTTTVSILGSLIVLVGAISTFAHALFH